MEVYTHRSGRTGRAGKTGVCLSICHSRRSTKSVRWKDHQCQSSTNWMFLRAEVCRKHSSTSWINSCRPTSIWRIRNLPARPDRKFQNSKQGRVLQRVAALEFNHFLKYYENAEDLNRPESRDRRAVCRKQEAEETAVNSTAATADYTHLFINLGTKDGFTKPVSCSSFLMKAT